MPPPRPWLSTELLDDVSRLDFRDQLHDALSSLDFQAALPKALDGLKRTYDSFAPAPLPIVLSPRPSTPVLAATRSTDVNGTPLTPETPTTPGASPDAAPAAQTLQNGNDLGQNEINTRPAGDVGVGADPDLPNLPASRPSPQGPTEPIPQPTPAPQAGGNAPDPSADPWGARAYAAAVKAGHPNPREFVEQMRWESGGFAPDVISGKRNSSAGAQGIAQIMPSTAAGWGVNPLDPDAALAAAARAMTGYYATYGGDSEKALAAYNMGEGNLQKYGPRGLPETDKYITIIHERSGQGAAHPTAGSAPAAPPAPPAAVAPQQPAAGAAPLAYKAMGGQPEPMPEDASIADRYWTGPAAERSDEKPQPAQLVVPWHPDTMQTGAPENTPAETLSYRQPLNGTSVSDLPDDPRDADQGPHEAQPAPTSSYNDPTDQGAQSTPLPAPAESPLKPLYDLGGRIIGYVHAGAEAVTNAAQGAVDQFGQNVAENRQWAEDANTGQGGVDFGAGAGAAAEQAASTLQNEGIVRPIARPISTAIRAATGRAPQTPEEETAPVTISMPFGELRAPDPIQPLETAVTQTARSLPSNVGAVSEGVQSGDYGQAGLGALGLLNDLTPSMLLARQLSELLPKADTPLGEIGAGDVVMTAALAHDVARLGYGAIKVGGHTWSKIAEAVSNGVPAERFSEWIAEGRRTASELNAADPGGTAAYGTLGAVPSAAPRPAENAPTFYSQLRRTIEAKMPNRAAPEQVQAIARGNGVKPDEIMWTGLDDFLREQKGPVTKQQVLDFLDQNEVKVEEVVKGGTSRPIEQIDAEMDALHQQGDITTDPALRRRYDELMAERTDVQHGTTGPSPTKYGQYTMPGGENYRELLLVRSQATREQDAAAQRIFGKPWSELNRAAQEVVGRESQQAYRSAHWDEPNVLAHVRFNERTAPDGKRVLNIEEIQSDWHQAGRKEGYQDPATVSQTEARRSELMAEKERLISAPRSVTPVRAESFTNRNGGQDWRIYDDAGRELMVVGATNEQGALATAERLGNRIDPATRERVQAVDLEISRLNQRLAENRTAVPAAPFQKTWPELAMKRMIRWAAENDFDRITWPPGSVHAERYNLAQHVDELFYTTKDGATGTLIGQKGGREVVMHDNVPANKLADYVGQDVARRMLSMEPDSTAHGDQYYLAGRDLAEMGGLGMKGFYDQILPTVAAKLGKKFGARVAELRMEIPGAWPRGQALQVGRTQTMHSLDITPAMKQSVLEQGQPLFATAGTLPPSAPTDRLGAVNRVLGQGVASSVSGGVGAAVNQQANPDDPNAGLKGFAVGALAPPLLSRGILRAAGKGAGEARGALAAFGHVPEPGKPNRSVAIGADPAKRYEFRYRVADLRDLIPSNLPSGARNPRFPQELQPRARERIASQLQIDQIARGLEPDALLTDVGRLDAGPMIVGPDRVVESGNGRTLALQRAAQEYPERYQAYVDSLRQNLGDYGLSEADLRGVKQPVLVRERVTQVDRPAFAAEANNAGLLRMSNVEQAFSDARNLSDDAVSNLTVGENDTIATALRRTDNRDAVRAWVGTLPSNERGGVLDASGQLSAQGYERLTNALLVRTYGEGAGERLARTFIESADPTVRNVQTALMASLPDVARSEALIRSGQREAGLSISEDVAAATEMLARLRRDGVSVPDYLSQSAMFERELTPIQEQVLGFLDQNTRRPSSIRETLKEYASRVENTADPNQGDMFGGQMVAASKEELWRAATAGSEAPAILTPLEASAQAGRAPADGAGLAAGQPEPLAPAPIDLPATPGRPAAPQLAARRPGPVPEGMAPRGGPEGTLAQEGTPPRLAAARLAPVPEDLVPRGGPEGTLAVKGEPPPPPAPLRPVEQFPAPVRIVIQRERSRPGVPSLTWMRRFFGEVGNASMLGVQALTTNLFNNLLEPVWATPKEFTRAALPERLGGRGNLDEWGAWMTGGVHGLTNVSDALIDVLRARGKYAAVPGHEPLSQVTNNPLGRALSHGVEFGTRVAAGAPDAIFGEVARGQREYQSAAEVITDAVRSGALSQSDWRPAWAALLGDVEAVKSGQAPQFAATQGVIDAGDRFAKRQTQQAPLGTIGKNVKDFATIAVVPDGKGGRKPIPVLGNLITPYFNSPWNANLRLMERTPGVGSLMNTQPKFDKTYDQAMGSALVLGLAGIAAQGVVTGKGPSDPEKRQEMLSQGWRPYSSLVNGVYVPNRVAWGVAAPLVNTAGDFHDAIAYRKPGTAIASPEVGLDVLGRFGSQLKQQPYLQGISDGLSLLDPTQPMGTKVAQYVASTATRMVPYASTIRAASTSQDPLERTTDRGKDVPFSTQVGQRIERALGMRSGLPVAQDVLGRPEANPQQGLGALFAKTSPEKLDPTIRVFQDVGVDIGAPPDTITFAGAPLTVTPDEQRRWNTLRGEALIRGVAPYTRSDALKRLPPAMAEKILRQQLDQAGQQADLKLVTEMAPQDRARRLQDALKLKYQPKAS